jgi:hypothetical protein
MFPTLIAATPEIVPEKVFDRVWIENVSVVAPADGAAISASVVFRKYRLKEDGRMEFNDERLPVNIQDIVGAAAVDQDLAAAVQSLMTYIIRIGRASGVVAGQ